MQLLHTTTQLSLVGDISGTINRVEVNKSSHSIVLKVCFRVGKKTVNDFLTCHSLNWSFYHHLFTAMLIPLIDTFLEICANNPLLLCPLVAFKVYIGFYNIGFDQTITSQILPTQVPSYFLYRLYTSGRRGH